MAYFCWKVNVICRNKHTQNCHISIRYACSAPLENVNKWWKKSKNPAKYSQPMFVCTLIAVPGVSSIHPSLCVCVYSHWDIKNVLVLFFPCCYCRNLVCSFCFFIAIVDLIISASFFAVNMLLLLFSIAFCIWNQIHLICISISTKISSDLLIYFAKDWIQYVNIRAHTEHVWRSVCAFAVFGRLSLRRRRATVATKTKCVFKMSDLFCSGYLLLSWILWHSHFCSTCLFTFCLNSVYFIYFFSRVCLYFTSVDAIACLSFS